MAVELLTDQNLLGVQLIEKDTNGDTFTTWSHVPFVDGGAAEYEPIAKKKSGIDTMKDLSSTPLQSFSKFKDKWIYIFTHPTSEKNLRVKFFSLILYSAEFNPEKYYALLTIMTNYYKSTNNPVNILQCFLDVITTTKHESVDNDGNKISFSSSQFNNKNHLLASSLLDIVRSFEGNAWFIWSALIMKKRVLVYNDQLGPLLHFVRALPLFVLHRQDWSLLRPFVLLDNEKEVNDLIKTGVYVAGVLSPAAKAREDLYDIYIDLTSINISVAPNAEDDFIQTQLHQDFAKLLTNALEVEGMNDQKLIAAIKTKTGDLIKRLETLKIKNQGDDKAYVSFASFSNQNIPANMENFLYAVASAEGMTKIGQ